MLSFETRAAFTFNDVSKILGVAVDTLRIWNARNPTNYLGAKTGHRIYFNALECYFYALVRDFTGFGVPVRTAMFTAARFADEAMASEGPIKNESLMIQTDGDRTLFELKDRYANVPTGKATLVLPLDDIWDKVMESAREIYSTEEA